MPSPFQLTEDAVRDLERTMDYLSQRSITAAARLADELESTFLFLAKWPHIGSARPDFADDAVRFWTVNDHIVAYIPGTEPLLILAVTHGSRDASPEISFRLGKL